MPTLHCCCRPAAVVFAGPAAHAGAAAHQQALAAAAKEACGNQEHPAWQVVHVPHAFRPYSYKVMAQNLGPFKEALAHGKQPQGQHRSCTNNTDPQLPRVSALRAAITPHPAVPAHPPPNKVFSVLGGT